MAYSTPAMVRKALVASSDGNMPTEPTHTAADLSNEQLTDAIAEADAMIDSYLSRFYAVPVAESGSPAAVPHPIDYWSRNIAAYNATLSFRGSQDFADQDPVARRYNATVEALKAVSAGAVGLNLPKNSTDSMAAGAGEPINPYVGELFTLDDFALGYTGSQSYLGPFWR